MSNTQVSRITQIGIYLGKRCALVHKRARLEGAYIRRGHFRTCINSAWQRRVRVSTMDTFAPGRFALISACIWVGIFNSIQNICKERAIIKRRTPRRAAYIKLYRLPPFYLYFRPAYACCRRLYCSASAAHF